jgi:hypothetical protein
VNNRVRPLGRIDNLRRTLVQHRMVVGFHPNPNYFFRSRHVKTLNSPLKPVIKQRSISRQIIGESLILWLGRKAVNGYLPSPQEFPIQKSFHPK